MDSTSSKEPATTGTDANAEMGTDATSRLGVTPLPGERLYPLADADTLAEWAAEVHGFLDDAEEAAERTRGENGRVPQPRKC
jgi:hypothetical protein